MWCDTCNESEIAYCFHVFVSFAKQISRHSNIYSNLLIRNTNYSFESNTIDAICLHWKCITMEINKCWKKILKILIISNVRFHSKRKYFILFIFSYSHDNIKSEKISTNRFIWMILQLQHTIQNPNASWRMLTHS